MDIGSIIKANVYWDSLTQDERAKILLENNFWGGFKTYHHEYIPEDLKTVLLLKIDSNDLNEK